jgi:hypothetical protein
MVIVVTDMPDVAHAAEPVEAGTAAYLLLASADTSAWARIALPVVRLVVGVPKFIEASHEAPMRCGRL